MDVEAMMGISRIKHSLLKGGALFPLWVGFLLLVLPFTARLDLEYALPSLKLISDLGGLATTVLLGVGLVVLGLVLRRRVIGAGQAANDRVAQQIMATLRRDPDASVPAFYLYLRAFETTGKLQVPLYLRLRRFSIGIFRFVTSDLESYVSSAVGSVVPLIGMGRPGEAVGAGRIAAGEQEWEGDVTTLMRRATGILLVPSDRPGTVWEIDSLKRAGLLGKVVFIMPPRTHGALDTRERWEAARRVLLGHGIHAPEHEERGLLFETGADGQVSNVEPLLLPSPRQVRKSLGRLLSEAPPRGGLSRSLAVAHQRARRAARQGWVETVRELLPIPLAVGALSMGSPSLPFNPADSWGTIWDRSFTAEALSGYGIQYLQGSISRGVVRIEDARLRAYFIAYGDMLARVDEPTCAAIARGALAPELMEVALTYIPSREANDFRDAYMSAEMAEQQGIAIPSPDSEAANLTAQEFTATLDEESRQRYERVAAAGDDLSDGDRCWFARTVFGAVRRLPEPLGSIWARAVAIAIVGTTDSTPSRPPP